MKYSVLSVTGSMFFLLLVGNIARAESVAVYPVKTEGFKLNQSEVSEMHRIALQACYDVGLQCSGRGQTVSSVQREQKYSGGGNIASSNFIAECALVGKTEDRVNVGMKKGGLNVFGGAAKKVGSGVAGVGSQFKTSGVRVGAGGMNLACQFSRTADGILVFSETDEKMGLSGELILFEARSSNSKKLHSAFKKMFDKAKDHFHN